MVGTGEALGGKGGKLHLTVGSGNLGAGGDAKVLAGETSAETGGSLTSSTGTVRDTPCSVAGGRI